jgi:hypothetical protein
MAMFSVKAIVLSEYNSRVRTIRTNAQMVHSLWTTHTRCRATTSEGGGSFVTRTLMTRGVKVGNHLPRNPHPRRIVAQLKSRELE